MLQCDEGPAKRDAPERPNHGEARRQQDVVRDHSIEARGILGQAVTVVQNMLVASGSDGISVIRDRLPATASARPSPGRKNVPLAYGGKTFLVFQVTFPARARVAP